MKVGDLVHSHMNGIGIVVMRDPDRFLDDNSAPCHFWVHFSNSPGCQWYHSESVDIEVISEDE
jgi:hypothetical protein